MTIRLLLAALLLSAPVVALGGLRGDLDGDDEVSGSDIQPFAEALLSPSPSEDEFCAADTNEDGALSIDDVAPMVDILLGQVPSQYAVRGHWDTPFDFGLPGAAITPIHLAVVPTPGPGGEIVGQAYAFGHYGDPNFYFWNPTTDQFTAITFPFAPFDRQCQDTLPTVNSSLFCSGHSFLPDGKVLHTGGDIPAFDLQCTEGYAFAGPSWAFEFDPLAAEGSQWTQVDSMADGRWYPTNTALPDGRTLVVSGFDQCSTCSGGQPVSIVNVDNEIYAPGEPLGGRWSLLTQKDIPLYPFMHVVGSGEILLSGPGSLAERLDLQTGVWTPVDWSTYPYRGSGTAVLMPGDTDSVMIIGGECCGLNATNTTEIIDLSDATPQWTPGPSMVHARTHANAVILPDGSIAQIGGRRDVAFGGVPDPVYEAEILDPSAASPAWQEMAAMCRARMYHSTAVLLPDGRVLAAGSTAVPPQFPHDEHNAEVFYPPYLFKGPRPVILDAPASAAHGEQITVTTPVPAAIVAVSLVRPSAVTHSFNQEQRLLQLAFATGALPAQLEVTLPGNPNDAPPGYYMLFLLTIGNDGQSLVPSVARFIRLDL